MGISGYDIIGDVHGCALTLRRLLEKLGYKQEDGVYFYPGRQAVFVGDIVDRGPHIREALHIVKNMVDAGSAQCVMGNHEYNALGYVTPTPETEGQDHEEYVRAHNVRHNRMIAETLIQFASYPEEWRVFLEWFHTLPVYLDLGDCRVVHACWDEGLIDTYIARGKPKLDKTFIQASADKASFEGQFMDRLTRGTDMKLPNERVIVGRDGNERRFFRTKFWSSTPQTYQDIVFQPDPLPEDMQNQRLSDDEKQSLLFYDTAEVPVFVGHYWLHGKPKPLRHNVACLDYSAVKYGRLAAYRYDGEQRLNASKFAWVYVDNDSHMGTA